MKKIKDRQGFTLVEIMIVVAIVGLLASLGIPNMLQAGESSRTRRFAKEVTVAAHAFTMHSFENGSYPADKYPAIMPDGMTEYLNKFPWFEETVVGGNWDWDYGVFGVTAGVSVSGPRYGDEEMVEVDRILDDGNLNSGDFRKRSGGYIYIIEK